MKNSVFFSIIVPCYNLSKFKIRFYESLLSQTFSNFEVICVDDCSTDNTYEYLYNIKEEKKLNIKVFKNSVNMGPGPTRNFGIDKSEGEYILFLDSDDELNISTLQNIYEVIKVNGKIDAVIYDSKRVFCNCEKGIRSFNKNKEGFVDKNYALINIPGSTCGKCYNRKMIIENKVIFLDLRRNEDIPFTKVAIFFSNKIYYIPKVFYHYIDVESSLTNNKKISNYNYAFSAFDYIKTRIDYMKFLKIYFIKYCYYNTITNMLSSHESNREIYKKLKEIRKKYSKYYTWYSKYFTDFHTFAILFLTKFKMLFLIKILLKRKFR